MRYATAFLLLLVAGCGPGRFVRTGRARRGTARRVEVSLSDVMRAIARFTASFERELQKLVDGLRPGEPRAVGDVLFFARFKAGAREPPPGP